MNEEHFKTLIKSDQYQVFLFTCPATFPFNFARHPWFVVNQKGTISRWEVFWRPRKCKTSWGHLHKNFYPPTQGISRYFFSGKYLWKKDIKFMGFVEGNVAKQMIEFIEASPNTYPYCYTYHFKGPNSNTYVQWILDKFPDSKLWLPWNSFGKRYKST